MSLDGVRDTEGTAMEYLLENHRTLTKSHLDQIWSQVDRLKDIAQTEVQDFRGLNKVNPGSYIYVIPNTQYIPKQVCVSGIAVVSLMSQSSSSRFTCSQCLV